MAKAKKKEKVLERYEFYNGEVELFFDRDNHVFWRDGVTVPNITKITGMMAKFLTNWVAKVNADSLKEEVNDDYHINIPIDELEILIEKHKGEHRRVSALAKDIGTDFHSGVEWYWLNNQNAISYQFNYKEAEQAFVNYENWLNGVGAVDKVAIEQIVYSRKYNYAGIIDQHLLIGNKGSIIETKTSSGIWNDNYFQLAAQRWALYEMTGVDCEGSRILRLFKDGEGYEEVMQPLDWKKDFDSFLGLLTVYKRDRELTETARLAKKEAKTND